MASQCSVDQAADLLASVRLSPVVLARAPATGIVLGQSFNLAGMKTV